MLQRRGSIAEGRTREEIPERRSMNATMAIKNTKETGLLVAGDGTLDKAGVLEQRKNKESQSSLFMREKSGSIEKYLHRASPSLHGANCGSEIVG